MNRKDSLAAGYTDKPLGEVGKCKNCGKNSYYQTTATEYCTSCGLFFDYWDCKSSPEYDAYQLRRRDRQDAEEEERNRKACTCGSYPSCTGSCGF